MKSSNRRKSTRSQVWSSTVATINILNVSGYGSTSISGQVRNLGAEGMFLKTSEAVPVHAAVGIIIDFNSEHPTVLRLKAYGETVRRSSNGIGIRFTQINLDDLQEFILKRMNM